MKRKKWGELGCAVRGWGEGGGELRSLGLCRDWYGYGSCRYCWWGRESAPICCLTLVIGSLTTHPFRDGAPVGGVGRGL